MTSKTYAQELLEQTYKDCNKTVNSRMLAAVTLFDFFEILTEQSYPNNWLSLLEEMLASLSNACSLIDSTMRPDGASDKQNIDEVDLAYKTGEVYFQLWQSFQTKEYFDKTSQMLNDRFKKNSIDVSVYKNGLDAGCGSGRYTYALKKSGVGKMTGIDISQNSIAFAREMVSGEPGIKFDQGSTLDLPYKEDAFDFVFSNGVLHHTTDTEKGLEEIRRVLSPRGGLWLYLYGGKDSFFWDVVDCCRRLLNDVSQTKTIMFMKGLDYSAGRIFHRNDFFYVPIHNRYYESEVLSMLDNAGFNNAFRLKQGFKHDWDEIISANPKIDPYLFGEGEMRFWING